MMTKEKIATIEATGHTVEDYRNAYLIEYPWMEMGRHAREASDRGLDVVDYEPRKRAHTNAHACAMAALTA